MKAKTTAHEDAITVRPASVTATEIAQEVRRLDRRERLQKLGLHIGPTAYFVRTHESPEGSTQRMSTQLTSESVSDRTLRLSKFILYEDVLEVDEGEREPPDKVYRRLADEEVTETFADARSLQMGARIRKLQAPIAKAEGDLRRIAGDISNSREILAALQQRLGELEEEKEEKERNIERARKPIEEFFAGRSPEWRAKALEEASRDRDALPPVAARGGPTVFGVQRDRVVALNGPQSLEGRRAFTSSGDAVRALRVEKER
jgi:hypothetical protein